jgi:hypothetical protein
MIEEIKLNGLDNKPIKTTKKPPPRSINENLPPCYFTSIFIGSKGSGKTYSLIKLLKNYEKYPIYDNEGHKLEMRVIVFCPTIMSTANPIYDSLKYLDEDDIIMEYTDGKLSEKLDEIEKEKEEIENYKKYVEVWKKYIKIDENINLLLPDELLILSKYDFRDPQDVPHPPYKYPRVNFLVFDDLVGDANAFKRGHSAINNLCIKHRHLQCNLLFTTQYIKAIPPVLRRNLDIFVIFKFANAQSVVEQIYPEISGVIKEEDFKDVFEYATNEKHDALIIDQTAKHIFKLNWDTALIFNQL